MSSGLSLPRGLLVMALVLACAWGTTERILLPFIVDGPSMSPALEPGDHVLVDRWSYRQRRPRPGEIALLTGPDGRRLVKRVARREGSAIWVRGDNTPVSVDSRSFGPVAAERFQGRLLWRYWPLSRAGAVR